MRSFFDGLWSIDLICDGWGKLVTIDSESCQLAHILIILLIALFCFVFGFVWIFSNSPRPLTLEESYIYVPKKQQIKGKMGDNDNQHLDMQFPCIYYDKFAELDLTVVVPAYNEAMRLPNMLDHTIDWLVEKIKKCSDNSDRDWSLRNFEIIVVDDGSYDDTVDRVGEIMDSKFDAISYKDVPIRVLKLCKNRGKGGAVTQGILCARGRYILFADADGATEFAALDLLMRNLLAAEAKNPECLAIGSRAHLVKSDAVVKRSLIRNILMYCFHFVVYLICAPGVRNIKDTQCGFKLFTRAAARKIFPFVHVEGWIFDIEVLQLAFLNGMKVIECPVNWREIEGSKMSLLHDSLGMAIDLLVIRLNYLLGIWKYQEISDKSPASISPWRLSKKTN